ncbi:Uncharacterized protein OBRU01_26259 [Operophtera brumata]|uniref:Uncharacterized protein n=1 Tax=Operophtera brumata TaxID=104452 RepID=A0A0L7K454_OPEBR|nr:Uncharacterized protein OBRU01_26259 [Operophtera brumata]
MPTIYSNDPLAAIMELDAKLESCAASFEGRLSSASSTSNPSIERAFFNDARKIYGVHKCWSQEGSVYLLTSDGTRHRLLSQAQLKEITQKFPPTKPGLTARVIRVRGAEQIGYRSASDGPDNSL